MVLSKYVFIMLLSTIGIQRVHATNEKNEPTSPLLAASLSPNFVYHHMNEFNTPFSPRIIHSTTSYFQNVSSKTLSQALAYLNHEMQNLNTEVDSKPKDKDCVDKLYRKLVFLYELKKKILAPRTTLVTAEISTEASLAPEA